VHRPFGLVVTLLALVLLSGLTACGRTELQPSPAPGGGPTPTVTVPFEMPVTVSLVGEFREGELALLEEQIARFEAENPAILVEIVEPGTHSGSLRETLGQALEVGDRELDVLVLDDAWLAQFAARGWLAPLDDYVAARGVALNGFFPGTIEASTINGQVWALPWIADGGLLYYREDLLARYGLAVPVTWPDVQRTALELQRQAGLPLDYVWQGAAYESLTCNTLEFVWASGGAVLDSDGNAAFDSPQNRAALQQMSALVTTGASPEDIVTYREGTTLNSFRGGASALMRNWPYAWDRLRDDDSAVEGLVGAVPLPASCLFGQVLALSADSMVPEQAFRLMEFLVAGDQQLQLARELGRPPALKQVYDDPGLLQARPFFGTLRLVLDQVRPRPRSAVYPQLSEAIYSEVNRMLSGEQDAGETATRVQERIEAALGAGSP